MPVPTDTYWKISRLNKVFAVSAMVLLGTMGWAVLQDYDKHWRQPQQSGKVWEAALVSEKLVNYEGVESESADLAKRIESAEAELAAKDQRYNQLKSQIAKTTSDLANLDFRTNTLKAVAGEQAKYLEEARTANDEERIRSLTAKLAEPQAKLAEQIDEQFKLKAQLTEARQELAKLMGEINDLKKEHKQKTEERDALQKKLVSLEPEGFFSNISAGLRRTPLLQFINPSEKVRQQVVPDVLTDLGGFKRVEAIDRCTTCHVNIDKREFSEESVLAYLEEQLATSRKLILPTTFGGKAGDPLATTARPGAAAMPEFWIQWPTVAAPEVMKKPSVVNRLKSIAGTVGKADAKPAKPVQVLIDAKPLPLLTLTPDPAKPDDQSSAALSDTSRLDVIAIIATAWLQHTPGKQTSITRKNVTIQIAESVDEKLTLAQRRTVMLLAEDLRAALTAALPPEKLKLTNDRYRRSLVAEVNPARRANGLSELDASPVMLAHPQLDLYADVDSKHPVERVGCTSCHDGSGQETTFILAAHTPRSIWVDQSTGAPLVAQQLKFAEPPKPHPWTLESMLHAVYPEGALTPAAVNLLHLSDPHHAEKPTTRPTPTAAPDEAPPYTPPIDYIDPVTGSKGKAVSQLMYWKKKYESEAGQTFETTTHYWDFPMRPPQYLQASCVRCHTSVVDIKETAPVVHEGRHLFTNLGCVNCHQMDSIPASEQRKVGTDLRHVTAKLSAEMINTWIWSPKAFRPTTKMPHFFMLENNSSDEEIRRTRQEARAMTEYLIQTAEPLPPKHAVPAGLTGKLDDGRKVFNTVGCLACHQNLNDPTDAKRNGKPVTRGEQWIVQDLALGGKLERQLTLDRGKPPAAAELTADAVRIFDGMSYNERQLYVLENLDESQNKTGVDTYADAKKTPKPVFMHHGPELSGVGSKLTAARTPEQARAWLYDWLKEPRHYSEYTVMPSLRLTDQQALDLVEYLLAQKRTNTHPDDQWKASLTEVDTSKLIELTGLFLRSRYSPQMAQQKADDDRELRALAIDALKTPNIDQAAAERRVGAMSKDEQRMIFLGKKLISHYGCMQCHAINGAEQMATPCVNLSDWGQKLVSKLAFEYVDPHKAENLPPQKIEMVNGLSVEASNLAAPIEGERWAKGISHPVEAAWPHVHHSRESWLTQKLKNTRIWDRGRKSLEPVRSGNSLNGVHGVVDSGKPYDKLRMPTFYLADEQVDALVTFVISNRDRLVTQKITTIATSDTSKRIAHGRYLVTEKFNCTSCHQMEKNRPQVHQYYDQNQLAAVAPPSLRGEGNKVQHNWLFGFLKNVEPLRPVLVDSIRMPTFPATDDEWTAILAYFADVSNKESRQLKQRFDPILKYIAVKQQSAVLASAAHSTADPSITADGLAAGDDWFQLPALQPNVRELKRWGLENRQISEGELDVTKNSPAELLRAYRKLLYRARFVHDLYATPYPFVATPRSTPDAERFARGEAFFHEMQCLSCHYLGKPAPGAVPKAPNLNLAHARLRRDWVHHWVREPDAIQKGTSMPQFFSGQKVDSVAGQTWARAQEIPLDRVAQTEAAYGSTPQEQIELLLDYVYAAGATGHNSVPLPSGSKPPSVTMEERGEIKVVPIVPPQPATKPAVAEVKPPEPLPPKATGPTGMIAGKVVFEGTPPKQDEIQVDAACAAHHENGLLNEAVVVSDKGDLKNVIVSVTSGLSGPHPVPTDTAVIDQRGCQYVPHVLPVMVGQKVKVKNSDPFMHNVNALAKENPAFNIGQPNVDPGKDVGPFKTPETFRMKCDVHPWMGMYVAVLDHPYFAVTGADGTFTLPPLPSGTYTVTFWHEKLGTQEKEITVEAGKKADASIRFKAGD